MDGLQQQTDMEEFIEELEKSGLETITLHISGHADILAIKRLIRNFEKYFANNGLLLITLKLVYK